MANWTKEIATEFNFPNITVYRLLKDGVHNSWRFVPNEGCVLRNPSDNFTEPDPVTLEPVPVTYYYTNVDCPLNYDFDNFTYIAVLCSTVDENYIM